jgi:hypothetical protein
VRLVALGGRLTLPVSDGCFDEHPGS